MTTKDKTGTAYKKTRNYLQHTLKYKVHHCHAIMRRYGKSIGKPRPEKISDGEGKYYMMIGEEIQKDWNAFMKFYGTIKDEYPKNFHKKRGYTHQSYDDWWQESNLDGSFAYNGVTDDF